MQLVLSIPGRMELTASNKNKKITLNIYLKVLGTGMFFWDGYKSVYAKNYIDQVFNPLSVAPLIRTQLGECSCEILSRFLLKERFGIL